MEETFKEASLEFKWLKKRGLGGKERKVQFYESFVYDGVEYALYDCVYMYKEGLPEPYIGKLTKIWEHLDNKTKKVKVHWFFRPEEISVWLGGIKTLENEILFASGEGVGLANVNPLEAIAGQCNVVCVSKDCRNPQPSDKDLKAADFVFYRSFDVQSCSISDKMEEKVGEVEIKYIFNRKKGESISPLPIVTSDRKEENQNTITSCGEEQPLLNKNPPNKTPVDSDKLHDPSLKKIKHDDKKPPSNKQVELKVTEYPERLTDMPSNKSKADSSINLPVNNLEALGISGTNEDKPKQKNGKVLGSEKGIFSKLSDDVEGRTLKKRNAEGSLKMPDNKKNGSFQKLSINKESKVEQTVESKRQLSMSRSPKVSVLSGDGEKKPLYQEFVVGPKPNADKSGWFRRLPWEERLKNAYDQGTAILLHNVDPDYTSGEVEDIIWHAFTEYCEAKILQCTAVSSPNYCQALILLKTKEASQKILSKLDEECLMLSNGRPLVATTCPPISSRKNSRFFGHLAIDKYKFQNPRDMDEAVSTSHFSQPNTIEYDMAMEWCLLQSRSKKWWETIHKQQGNELKKLQTILARK